MPGSHIITPYFPFIHHSNWGILHYLLKFSADVFAIFFHYKANLIIFESVCFVLTKLRAFLHDFKLKKCLSDTSES